jgi:hypothetical protein
MTGLGALQAVQFVARKGKRFAVLGADDWEALVEWLETAEDSQIACQATRNSTLQTATVAGRAGGSGIASRMS